MSLPKKTKKSKSVPSEVSKDQEAGTPKKGAWTHKFKVSDPSQRTVDGIVFDSKIEARIYCLIRDRLPTSDFTLQPEFILQEGFVDFTGHKQRPIIFNGDFLIARNVGIRPPLTKYMPGDIIIDVKGMKLPVYAMKKKMFMKRYPHLELYEIKSGKQMTALLDQKGW